MDSPSANNAIPLISIVIPTLDGHRDGKVPRLLESIERQSLSDCERLLITGISPQGRAINMGARQARGKYLVILDDDSELADEHVLARLAGTLENDPSIGMAGASIVIAPDATAFQRRAARQFPRFNTPVVERVTDSDLACHGCCALSRAVFWEIGGEREDIPRGLDPDLRIRLRQAGYRIVLAPGTRVYHPLPDGWCALMRLFFRNGFGSGYTRKFHPDAIYETLEILEDNRALQTSLGYRIARFAARLAVSAILGRFQRFVAYCAYAAGYVWAVTTAEKRYASNAPRP